MRGSNNRGRGGYSGSRAKETALMRSNILAN